jgi:alkanesulfonate monooxygenase SsuD/methylene tetrahydromethanopterin reductase-like flavin-dependent oxidoreductase (luciferase family)
MRLGIGLPNWLGNVIPASAMLDWARIAEDAGFEAVGVHDKPNHDTWDPLATLAGVAVATERVRLATTALLLPPRDEALVAKQAAVVDRLSNGRLDLGVAVGIRPDDFELFGRSMAGRGKRYERQLQRILELWADARATAESGAGMGPDPIQDPHPPLWVGGYAPAAVSRAMRYGDGYIFGAADVELIASRIAELRSAAAAAGRSALPTAALAYVLPTTDEAQLADGETLLLRYYGTLRKPFRELVVWGEPADVVARLRDYEATGLDRLYLLPVARTTGSLERLARDVLPSFP